MIILMARWNHKSLKSITHDRHSLYTSRRDRDARIVNRNSPSCRSPLLNRTSTESPDEHCKICTWLMTLSQNPLSVQVELAPRVQSGKWQSQHPIPVVKENPHLDYLFKGRILLRAAPPLKNILCPLTTLHHSTYKTSLHQDWYNTYKVR